jgi:type IV secretory pathway TrbD component
MRLWRLTLPRPLLLVGAPLASALLEGGLAVVLAKRLSKGEDREVVVAPAATATVAATPWAKAGVMPPSDALPA